MKTLLAVLTGALLFAAPALAHTEEPAPTRILVVYHSETGNTEGLGKALLEETRVRRYGESLQHRLRPAGALDPVAHRKEHCHPNRGTLVFEGSI